MQTRFKMLLTACTLFLCRPALAETKIQVTMVDEKGIGRSVGEVALSETSYGVVFSPSLFGLPAGLHGFHVHENPSCEPNGKDEGRSLMVHVGGDNHADHPALLGGGGERLACGVIS